MFSMEKEPIKSKVVFATVHRMDVLLLCVCAKVIKSAIS